MRCKNSSTDTKKITNKQKFYTLLGTWELNLATHALSICFGSRYTTNTIFSESLSDNVISILRQLQPFLSGAFSPLDWTWSGKTKFLLDMEQITPFNYLKEGLQTKADLCLQALLGLMRSFTAFLSMMWKVSCSLCCMTSSPCCITSSLSLPSTITSSSPLPGCRVTITRT